MGMSVKPGEDAARGHEDVARPGLNVCRIVKGQRKKKKKNVLPLIPAQGKNIETAAWLQGRAEEFGCFLTF